MLTWLRLRVLFPWILFSGLWIIDGKKNYLKFGRLKKFKKQTKKKTSFQRAGISHSYIPYWEILLFHCSSVARCAGFLEFSCSSDLCTSTGFFSDLLTSSFQFFFSSYPLPWLIWMRFNSHIKSLIPIVHNNSIFFTFIEIKHCIN